ncbi:MAG: glycosyltransferase family 4 protein [Ruminococcaceae bacterium]|nr:glycosyltransferase family 4 protein [Oscillospiraceae bacterium]
MSAFEKVLSEKDYDIIHVFGTELLHTHEMASLMDKQKTVISIQGLIYAYADLFFTGIPHNYIKKSPVKTLINRIHTADFLRLGQEGFYKVGESEKQFIKSAKYIIGRTEWDRACIEKLNPEVTYYNCFEILRDEFYAKDRWNEERCEKHSVFISQGDYPIKGLHLALKAFSDLKKIYPDLKVYLAGEKHVSHTSPLKRAVSGYLYEYNGYIEKLIRKYDLADNIVHLGKLSAEQMKQQYLNANVYVLPSLIENSSNSLGEAMMLGVPCVASNVGGMSDMLVDKSEGYLYPLNETYMLEHYIKKVFDGKMPKEMLDRAAAHAARTHNRKKNTEQLIKIYNDIASHK